MDRNSLSFTTQSILTSEVELELTLSLPSSSAPPFQRPRPPSPPHLPAMSLPLPNILITGTPGTGKTTFSQLLAPHLTSSLASLLGSKEFKVVNVGDVVKDEKAHNGWDEEWEAWLVDEDKVSGSAMLAD